MIWPPFGYCVVLASCVVCVFFHRGYEKPVFRTLPKRVLCYYFSFWSPWWKKLYSNLGHHDFLLNTLSDTVSTLGQSPRVEKLSSRENNGVRGTKLLLRVRVRNLVFRKKWSVLPLAKVKPCGVEKKGFYSSSTKFQWKNKSFFLWWR